jgi:hypothetical protein
MSHSIKTFMCAAVIGLALAGSAVVAMPAQAAPSFSFGFHVGGGHHGGYRPGPSRHCLTNPEVRRLLNRHGYDRIRFIDRRGRIVAVRAERGRGDFRVTVDSCRGRIVDVDRLRRR